MKPTVKMLIVGAAAFSVNFRRPLQDVVARIYEAMDAQRPPLKMILHCPNCRTQHIDAPDPTPELTALYGDNPWTNPPHRSHLCAACGWIWRPADICTEGVASIETRGKNDTVPG